VAFIGCFARVLHGGRFGFSVSDEFDPRDPELHSHKGAAIVLRSGVNRSHGCVRQPENSRDHFLQADFSLPIRMYLWITSALPTNRELSRRLHGYPVIRQVFWVRHAPAKTFTSREFRSARIVLTMKRESHSATTEPLAHYSLS